MGVSKMEVIKKRTLSVTNMTCHGCGEKIIEELSKLNGIREVYPDSRIGKVTVVYDLLQIDLKDIEIKLNDLGYTVQNNFINRLKNNFLHFLEENEKSNLTAKPLPCCSNPKDILEKTGERSFAGKNKMGGKEA